MGFSFRKYTKLYQQHVRNENNNLAFALYATEDEIKALKEKVDEACDVYREVRTTIIITTTIGQHHHHLRRVFCGNSFARVEKRERWASCNGTNQCSTGSGSDWDTNRCVAQRTGVLEIKGNTPRTAQLLRHERIFQPVPKTVVDTYVWLGQVRGF
jgi:hypothetical protein